VDKTATRIWFAFFPLDLARALQQAEDPQQLAVDLLLFGNYRLRDQIDTSHRFLYGHRYWPQVKAAVAELASSERVPSSLELSTQICEVAGAVATSLGVRESLVVGMSAVAFMTLQQVGLAAFAAYPGTVSINRRLISKSPEQVLKDRARGDGQGMFGFLRGERKVYPVRFDENDDSAKFKLINSQEITTAAADDKRDYTTRDARCVRGEGPIPVQCRSAACGTCWIGVLSGAEKLSDVGRLEGARIKHFGYIDTAEARPLIRLACRAQAFGAVSIVIPPWNGVYGDFLRRWREGDGEKEKTAST
jgi:ferredoxin